MSAEEESLYCKGKGNNQLVKKYQEFIKNSDSVILIFSIWLNKVLAMLKGFFDKVFIKEFAFVEESNRHKGLLTNIRSVVLITTLESNDSYIKNDLGKPIENTIIKATLEVVGMSNIKWINNNMESYDKVNEEFLLQIEN